MPYKQPKKPKGEPKRVAFLARLSWDAYDAIYELQRQHRRRTDEHLPLWKVLDAAVRAYAKKKGIRIGQ